MEKLLLVFGGFLEALTKALGRRAPRWLTRLNGLKTGARVATVAVTAPAERAADDGDADGSDHLGGVYLRRTQSSVSEPALRSPMNVVPINSWTAVSVEAVLEQEVANSGSLSVEPIASGPPPGSPPMAVAEASLDRTPTRTSAIRIEQDIMSADLDEVPQVPLEEIPSIPEAADPTRDFPKRELAGGSFHPPVPSIYDPSPESPAGPVAEIPLGPMPTSTAMVQTEPALLPTDTGKPPQQMEGPGVAAAAAGETATPLDEDVAAPVEAVDDGALQLDYTTIAAADCIPDLPHDNLADDLASSIHQEAPDVELQASVDATDGSTLSAVDDRSTETDNLAGNGATEPPPEAPALFEPQSRQPAVHRDRRGKRRTVAPSDPPAQPYAGAPGLALPPPAEAKLRLSLRPIRRTARLSVVMTRPDGFPARVTVVAAASHTVEAYDERRYDDLDLPWTSELLEGELRLVSTERLQWLRSARQVHVFAADPNEPDLISVSAVSAGIAHTLLCRSTDAEAVRVAAESTGSPAPQLLEHWHGIPEGWIVLSGYTPMRSATPPLPAGLRPLDPGKNLEIVFDGGLAIRPRVYAAGHPPGISINPAPGGASVTIGDQPATLSSDGTWVAPGWDTPGQHMVDVVPGPSVSYEIAADPWLSGGWDFWDAYPARFGENAKGPWARARICGALVLGPAGEMVIAHEALHTLVALGARSGATQLRQRDDLAVSVGLTAEPPAFLLSATGARRKQGRVVWLGSAPTQNASKQHDAEWVATVRNATARRLPLIKADALGEDAWRKAKKRARQLRSRRPHT
ncbi:hypothetical protein [Mesorhizobium shangrilense]|uniref:Uncharacterized protein n=1 Tax=Mesorhizobium shangrilense TaxID=460060 RepID=A0ABV2DJ35_9HYPH